MRALERALAETRGRLEERAIRALDAPSDPEGAFSFLSARTPRRDGESVVLFDHNRPLAWSGAMRVDPDTVVSPVSVTFSPFYTTLNVARTRGERRAVASAVASRGSARRIGLPSAESTTGPARALAGGENS